MTIITYPGKLCSRLSTTKRKYKDLKLRLNIGAQSESHLTQPTLPHQKRLLFTAGNKKYVRIRM